MDARQAIAAWPEALAGVFLDTARVYLFCIPVEWLLDTVLGRDASERREKREAGGEGP